MRLFRRAKDKRSDQVLFTRLPSYRDDAVIEAGWRDWRLEHDGLLDPGQPTESAHVLYVQRMTAPFSPLERRMIRYALGL